MNIDPASKCEMPFSDLDSLLAVAINDTISIGRLHTPLQEDEYAYKIKLTMLAAGDHIFSDGSFWRVLYQFPSLLKDNFYELSAERRVEPLYFHIRKVASETASFEFYIITRRDVPLDTLMAFTRDAWRFACEDYAPTLIWLNCEHEALQGQVHLQVEKGKLAGDYFGTKTGQIFHFDEVDYDGGILIRENKFWVC